MRPVLLPLLLAFRRCACLLALEEESAPGGAEEEDGQAVERRNDRAPSVVFHVMGTNHTKRPLWAEKDDKVSLVVAREDCPSCPRSAKIMPTSRVAWPTGWWCAQRTYLPTLKTLVHQHPASDYYMLIDFDTVVFPQPLRSMLIMLEQQVLDPKQDLYMGHGVKDHRGKGFIMTGGGALLRGQTLRKLVKHPNALDKCAKKHLKGKWCWHHLDWVLGDCLEQLGIRPVGHEAFQQSLDLCKDCCDDRAISCHPVRDPQEQRDLVRRHSKQFSLVGSTSAFDRSWARPCGNYSWSWKASTCLDAGRDMSSQGKQAADPPMTQPLNKLRAAGASG